MGRRQRSKGSRGAIWNVISGGALVILILALVSEVLVAIRPYAAEHYDVEMWAFARTHVLMYEPIVAEWNKNHADTQVDLVLMGLNVETQRLQSGFCSDTPVPDLMEVERGKIGALFAGPVDHIGLVDLKPRLIQEGLLAQINEPSFSPWSNRGHIFGLPHDVHPVMLAYRSDLVEAAGIDVSQIDTWDDFVRVLRPLMKERDAEGKPKHYLLNMWPTSLQLEALILQADGGYFDDAGNPRIDCQENARVISTVVQWTTGPDQMAADAPEFVTTGNQMRVEGYVICSIMPDWLCGTWFKDIPQLSGKLKLMPLPAWDKGSRHTSVWGGTMLGISSRAKNFEKAWTVAKQLYLNEQVAEKLYREVGIVSPVKKNWSRPIYDEPSAYFSGQAPGRLFIQLAPQVPRRTSSPFYLMAQALLQNTILTLRDYSLAHKVYDAKALTPEAHRLLAVAQAQLQRKIDQSIMQEDPAKETAP